jgi:hypothetical protein
MTKAAVRWGLLGGLVLVISRLFAWPQTVQGMALYQPESGDSTIRMVAFVLGGLLFLTIVLIVVIFFLMKKFRKY